ncbi:MAG: hypothetical protein Q8R92_17925 [Deltaproteobacteria bacterium]|nr:hypothetical protein [Deltaproteobacteria bacterium]
MRGFLIAVNEIDNLNSLGVAGKEWLDAWGVLISAQFALSVAGPGIQGAADAVIDELNRRVAARSTRQPMAPQAMVVEDAIAQITTTHPEEWADTRSAYLPAEPIPAEAAPALAEELSGILAVDELATAEEEDEAQRLAAELSSAMDRRDALADELASIRAGTQRLGALGIGIKSVARGVSRTVKSVSAEVSRATQPVVDVARQTRDSAARRFLPSDVRDFGRQVEDETRRAGRTFDRQLRRSVEDVAVRYGPWLRIAAFLVMPWTVYGMSLGLATILAVLSAEVSYNYHQTQEARRAAQGYLRALQLEVDAMNAEADQLQADLDALRATLALAISQRPELAAQLEEETEADLMESAERRKRIMLYGGAAVAIVAVFALWKGRSRAS